MDTERLKELLAPIVARLRLPWVAGTIALFLVVYLILGYSFYRQLPERDKLRTDIHRLAGIVARSAALERLAEKEAEFQAIQVGIPSAALSEIDVFQAMWSLAEETGLDRGAVKPKLLGTTPRQKAGNTQYRLMSFSLEVSGDFDRVWEFVQKLDQGETPFGTLVLERTSLTLGEGESASATVEFKIYTRVAGG